MKNLARLKLGFLHGGSIDERAVGGAEVLDDCSMVVDHDLAVRAGDRAVRDLEIIMLAAADGIRAGFEFDFPRSR
jgi:hypothetical protein